MDTHNHLYGLQFGAHVTPWSHGRFRSDITAKAGAFYNNATSLAFQGAGNSISNKRRDLAFAAELAITGAYEITDCIALRFGYQIIVVDGVALATDQLTTHDVDPPGVANTDTRGTVLYHGGLFGIELRR